MLCIAGVDNGTHLKMRLLAVGRGLTMAELLKELVSQAWNEDKSIPTPKAKSRMRKVIKKWKG